MGDNRIGTVESSKVLKRYLAYTDVCSNRAIENARQDYQDIIKRREEQIAAQEQLMGGEFQQIADPEKRRAAVLTAVNTAIFPHHKDLQILKLVKFLSDPPSYKLMTSKGAVGGDVRMLLSQQQFRSAVADAAGVVIPFFQPTRWHSIVQNLLDICTQEAIGAEATDEGFAANVLQAYIAARRTIAPEQDRNEAVKAGNPFMYNGAVHVVGADLQQYARVANGNVQPKRMGIMLRAAGCESVIVAFTREDGTRSSRSCWKVPKGIGDKV